MSDRLRLLERRLAEAAHTEAALRELIAILQREGEAVFASRSWRLGTALTGLLRAPLAWLGRTLPPAQSAAHWHELVAAHLDGLERRRALLAALEAEPGAPAEAVLAGLWHGDSSGEAPPRA